MSTLLVALTVEWLRFTLARVATVGPALAAGIPGQLGFGPLKEALGWAIEEAINKIEKILRAGFEALVTLVAEALDLILEPVVEIMLYAPAPETGGQVFAPPTNAPWTRIFGPLWASMVPLGLVLLIVSYFASEALSSLSIGLSDESRAAEREFGVVVGLFAIPLSRYAITLYLQTMRALTRLLTPGDMISLSDIARFNADAAAIAILLLAFLSGAVYVAVLAVHIFRIVGVILLAGAAPVLLGLYLGRFPVLDDVAKSLLRTLPVLGFAPVLLALAMRIMTAIFAADGGISIDGLGVASVVVQPLFLLAPGLLGVVIPITMIRSASAISAPSAGGTKAKSRTPKTASKAKEAGTNAAKQGAAQARQAPSRVRTRVEQRRINRDVGGGPNDDGDGGDDDGGGDNGDGDGPGGPDSEPESDNEGEDGQPDDDGPDTTNRTATTRSESTGTTQSATADSGSPQQSSSPQPGTRGVPDTFDLPDPTTADSGGNSPSGASSKRSMSNARDADTHNDSDSDTASSDPGSDADESADSDAASVETQTGSENDLGSLRGRDPVSRIAGDNDGPEPAEDSTTTAGAGENGDASSSDDRTTDASGQSVADALSERFGTPDDGAEQAPARSPPSGTDPDESTVNARGGDTAPDSESPTDQ